MTNPAQKAGARLYLRALTPKVLFGAVVAILLLVYLAVAIPSYQQAKARQRGSRLRQDQRAMATALETYWVDWGWYPAMTMERAESTDPSGGPLDTSRIGRTLRRSMQPGQNSLTTPVAYIAALPPDQFADSRGAGFRYFTDGRGWILSSYGPDRDEVSGGDLLWNRGNDIAFSPREPNTIEAIYDSSIAQPSLLLNTGASGLSPQLGAYTYDTTNGTVSQGDVWRVKQ